MARRVAKYENCMQRLFTRNVRPRPATIERYVRSIEEFFHWRESVETNFRVIETIRARVNRCTYTVRLTLRWPVYC